MWEWVLSFLRKAFCICCRIIQPLAYENESLAFCGSLPRFAAKWDLAPQHVRQLDGFDVTFSWCWCSIMRFMHFLWLRSTAGTIASQVPSATYDCGYNFFADSFQRLAIMAPLRVWLSVAPTMGFCQELTTMVPLKASSQDSMTTTPFAGFCY